MTAAASGVGVAKAASDEFGKARARRAAGSFDRASAAGGAIGAVDAPSTKGRSAFKAMRWSTAPATAAAPVLVVASELRDRLRAMIRVPPGGRPDRGGA